MNLYKMHSSDEKKRIFVNQLIILDYFNNSGTNHLLQGKITLSILRISSILRITLIPCAI